MRKEIICITGMPRSGTTFLLKSFKAIEMGNIQNSDGVKIIDTWGEPSELSKCFNSGVSARDRFQAMYKQDQSLLSGVLVYKHPQVLFVDTIPQQYKVKYIYCTRYNYENWRKSASKMDIMMAVQAFSNRAWIKNNWEQS